jgi:ABC-type glycerol-3-phosphate transport system substrate-binding protein
MWVRKDWMDTLGIAEPKTLNDFYNMLVAFKSLTGENGAPMQASLATPIAMENLFPIYSAFGVTHRLEYFKIDNGKLSIPAASNDMLTALKFLNRLYREGLLNSDFASLKDGNDARSKYFAAGKAGVLFGSGAWLNDTSVSNFSGGDAVVVGLPPFVASGYKPYPYINGVTNYPTSALSKDCKDPKKALEVLEYINSRPGRELLICGIKGIHYNTLTSDGIFDRNMENYSKDYDSGIYGINIPWGLEFATTCNGYIPVSGYKNFEEAYTNRQIYIEKSMSSSAYNLKSVIAWGNAWANPGYEMAGVNISSVASIATRINNDALAVYYLKIILEPRPENIDGLWAQFQSTVKDIGIDAYLAAYQEYYDKYIGNL